MFKPWNLERGQEHFECGQVVKLEDDDNLAHTEGSGSQVYHVESRHSRKRVDCISSDRSHADQDENCKQIALMLFAQEKSLSQPQTTLPVFTVFSEHHWPV